VPPVDDRPFDGADRGGGGLGPSLPLRRGDPRSEDRSIPAQDGLRFLLGQRTEDRLLGPSEEGWNLAGVLRADESFGALEGLEQGAPVRVPKGGRVHLDGHEVIEPDAVLLQMAAQRSTGRDAREASPLFSVSHGPFPSIAHGPKEPTTNLVEGDAR